MLKRKANREEEKRGREVIIINNIKIIIIITIYIPSLITLYYI